jgi:Tfp pilus assembly protein PilO
MKVDIKNILILILIIFSIIAGYMWFIKGDSASKERIKQLEEEFKKLERQKDSINISINKWKVKFDSLSLRGEELAKINFKLESDVKKAETDASISKANLDKLRNDISVTKKKIDELKNNPTKRTGDDLLNSIKNKTKK